MDAEGDRASSDDGANSVERSDRVVMLPTNRAGGGDDEEWGDPADSGGFPEEEKVEESFLEGWSTLFESGSSARKAPAPAPTTAVEEAGSFAVSNASAADNPSIISSAYSSTARGQNHPSTTMPAAQDPEATLKEPDASADAGSRPTRLVASRKKLLVIGALVLVAVALAVVLPIVLTKDSSSPSSATPPGGGNEVGPVCMNGQPPINNCVLIAGALAPVHPERTWSKLSTPGTCQHSALLWLSESEDILNIGGVQIQQRYALAVTFCEVLGGGDAWKETPVMFGEDDDDCFGEDLDLGQRTFNPNCAFVIIELEGQQQLPVLSGTLAPELSIASSLRKVSIKNDRVEGTIPPEYGNLELLSLDLSNNLLSGTIPPEIFTPTLEELLLHGNQLTGSIVIDLDVATNLKVVSLFDNSLSGDLNYVCGPGGSPAEFTVDIEVDCRCCALPAPTLSPTDAPAGSPALAPEAGPTTMPAMEPIYEPPKVTPAPIPHTIPPKSLGPMSDTGTPPVPTNAAPIPQLVPYTIPPTSLGPMSDTVTPPVPTNAAPIPQSGPSGNMGMQTMPPSMPPRTSMPTMEPAGKLVEPPTENTTLPNINLPVDGP